MLSDLGRRVLGHLPVWASNEKAHVKAEGGPDVSIRSYTSAELTERLLEDPFTTDMNEEQVESCLAGLEDGGLCEEGNGHWRMTKAGFEALHAPRDDTAQQVPGSVFVELGPARATANAEAS